MLRYDNIIDYMCGVMGTFYDILNLRNKHGGPFVERSLKPFWLNVISSHNVCQALIKLLNI